MTITAFSCRRRMGKSGYGMQSAVQCAIYLLIQHIDSFVKFTYCLFLLITFLFEFEQFTRNIEGGQDSDFHMIT